MSKINQIQQAIFEMNGGEFQKLADQYLVEKGFVSVNFIGSVVGSNKVRKGTPDTLIALPNGNYIFAEHNTQNSGVFSKIKSDLSKCFDKNKTGIPIERIERVVFCFYKEKLTAEEQRELTDIGQENGVILELLGIDAIASDLYAHYPGLALDFLGVQIDTGQIVSPKRFVSLYNSNKLATPLDLTFRFRKEELSQLLDALEVESLVILSGRAGVGKSRLALESCQRFNDTYPEYEVMCIFGRNRDLWEDLQIYFKKPGNFLIFVDDANRVSQFEYVIDLLLHQQQNQRIKVVATVRDYALSKIRQVAAPVGCGKEIVLQSFSDDQIKELIAEEYGIKNYHYKERITDIAQGNPRIAVMAAEVAKKEEAISSIYDVSSLYDQYFSSIRNDLKNEDADLQSTELLKVSAIVSFFKAVDRANKDMMSSIEEAFSISQEFFWKAANRLHELEILDMYEGEVARVSDQVLGTYLFYLATFKEHVLDFGRLLSNFFPKLRYRLIDSINPILNAFDSTQVIEVISSHVREFEETLKNDHDNENFLHLLDVFWFTRPTETLVWIKEKIDEIEAEAVEISKVSFVKGSNAINSPSILSILRQFVSADDMSSIQIALELLLCYVTKRPLETPCLLRVLIDDYGFSPTSYMRSFEIQRAVLDVVWSRVESGENLFSRMFLAIANEYLGTHFHQNQMKGIRALQIVRFDLPNTPELISLRETIWQRVFTLYRSQYLQAAVLELIGKYSTSHLRLTNSDIVKSDADQLLPFLESVIDSTRYWHCVILHEYLDLLERHNLEVSEELRTRFCNETFALAKILLPEWGERQELDLSYEEYEQYKRDRLRQYTADYTVDDFIRFFSRCLEIQKVLAREQNEYPLRSGVEGALLGLADRESDLYRQVLEYYLEIQDPFKLNGYSLVRKLIELCGIDKALQLLNESDYPSKNRWLFYLYEFLPTEAIDEERINQLYTLYKVSEPASFPHWLDYLLKYLPIDSDIVAKVVKIMLEKYDNNSVATWAFTGLFNPYVEVSKRLPELFNGNFALLEEAYFAMENTRDHSDSKGEVFNQLIDLDPDFILKYITYKYENAEHGWLSRYDDDRNYHFIWARNDYQEIMNKAVQCIYDYEKDNLSLDTYLWTFFQTNDNSDDVQNRQDAYLLRLMNERIEDVDFIEYLFELISHFSHKRRLLFVKNFVQLNENFETFKGLTLEPISWSSNGSWVPVLQGRIDYWKLLLPIMNTINLLPHKQYIEHQIRGLCAQIEQEKKRDFIAD